MSKQKIKKAYIELQNAIAGDVERRFAGVLDGELNAECMLIRPGAGGITLVTDDHFQQLFSTAPLNSKTLKLSLRFEKLVAGLATHIRIHQRISSPPQDVIEDYVQLAQDMRRCADELDAQLAAFRGPELPEPATATAAVTDSQPGYVQIRVDIEYGVSLPAGDYDTEALTAHVIRKSQIAIDRLHTQMAILTQESAHQFRKPAAEGEA